MTTQPLTAEKKTMSSPSKIMETKPVASASQKKSTWLLWCVSPRLWIRKIVRLNDTPHSIALGAAIGTFVAFTPTVGIQMLVVLAVAGICKPFFRFNKLAGLIAVYISNPITTLPIYWFSYWVGSFFVPGNLTRERLATVLNYQGLMQWSKSMWSLLIEIGGPLVLGSVIVGIICALPTYPVVKWLAETLQKRKHGRQANESKLPS